MHNGDSLLPGPDTFTYAKVERQLQIDTFSGAASDGSPPPFTCMNLEYSMEDRVHRYYSKQKQETLRESFCRKLYDRVCSAESHIDGLDALLCELVVCNFPQKVPDYNMLSTMRPARGEDWPLASPQDLVLGACDLLSRLPASPMHLLDDASTLDSAYYIKTEPWSGTSRSRGWHRLKVVSHISTNVIRVALMVAIYRMKLSGTALDSFINTTADLISTASRLSSVADSQEEKKKWFLVRAFLWTSWQRSSMLYFYSILGGHILSGFNELELHDVLLRGFYPSPEMSVHEMSRRFAIREKPAYMCGWAFELLRTDPSAIASDFRRFYQRFSRLFENQTARCIAGQTDESCRGHRPESCQRFKGMRIENQSMHHDDCQRDCRRLTWDETSYRNVAGARAVDIFISLDAMNIQYCQASERTLAISHVWSHGQGGRPEAGHGMNSCLHRRYSSIAKSMGCDSYWMDTPCIPEDHQLRKEAIMNINKIFEQSEATLICDRDLMSIDASNLTIETRETILVIAMICDWNLRAWTFLEAYRGRRNGHVLCKDNVVVSIKETVEAVYRQGCIDIALLLLTIPHLLPAFYEKDMKVAGNAFKAGFMTIAGAGSFLSHREASRPGDEMVIWSLLLDDKVYDNAEAFWLGHEGQGLPTSFLLSSTPRLKTPGLRWAPSSPAAQVLGSEAADSAYRLLALSNDNSEWGHIAPDGLRAPWLKYDMAGGLRCSQAFCSILRLETQKSEDKCCRLNLQRIRERFLKQYIFAALLRPLADLNDPSVRLGDISKTLIGVCATNGLFCWPWDKDDEIMWTWLGVYEWDMSEPMPKFSPYKDVYVV